MTRTLSWLRPLLCGVAIGALGIAPGVSGGALAASFGYYEPLLSAAAHPFNALKTNLKTLLPLGIGIASGVLLFGQLLLRLFSTFPTGMRWMVAGLIAGTLPETAHRAVRAGGKRRTLRMVGLAAFLLGLFLFYGNVFPKIGTPTGFLEWATCGGIYALGTVVPGVSSSCILISMNAYEAVLSVLGGENFAAILPLLVGFSVVAGGLVCIVNALYTKSEALMQAAVCGFVAASIFPVVPPFQADKTGMLSLLLGLLAAAATWWGNGRFSRKDTSLYSKNRADFG